MRFVQSAIAPLAVALFGVQASALTLTGNPQADGWRFLGNSLTGEAGTGDNIWLSRDPTYDFDLYATSFTIPLPGEPFSFSAPQGTSPDADPVVYADPFTTRTFQPGDRIFGFGAVIRSGPPAEFAFLHMDFDQNNGYAPASFVGAGDGVTENPDGSSLLTTGDIVFQVGGGENPPRRTWVPNFMTLAEVDNPTELNERIDPTQVSTPFFDVNNLATRASGLAFPVRTLANLETRDIPDGKRQPATTIEIFFNIDEVERYNSLDPSVRGTGQIGTLQDEFDLRFTLGGTFTGSTIADVVLTDVSVSEPTVIPEPVTTLLVGLGGLALVHRLTRRRADAA